MTNKKIHPVVLLVFPKVLESALIHTQEVLLLKNTYCNQLRLLAKKTNNPQCIGDTKILCILKNTSVIFITLLTSGCHFGGLDLENDSITSIKRKMAGFMSCQGQYFYCSFCLGL
jgi:hypothetical protein